MCRPQQFGESDEESEKRDWKNPLPREKLPALRMR